MATNNYFKVAVFLKKPLFFFFDGRVSEEVQKAYARAIEAKREHDSTLPVIDGKPSGSKAPISVWKKHYNTFALLKEDIPEVGQVVEADVLQADGIIPINVKNTIQS